MSARSTRVLVVDDDRQIRRFLRTILTSSGYKVVEASLGEQAIGCVMRAHPDLVILELDLPDLNGADVISLIRRGSLVPIIVLSMRSGELDKIDALDRGADDFVTKPFGAGELLARIRAAFRHRLRSLIDEPLFRCGALTVDLARRQVSLHGRPVDLTAREFEVLHHLVIHAGRVVSHEFLLREVWGSQHLGRRSNIRVCIRSLRRKIEPGTDDPRYIVTEPGVGYALRLPAGQLIVDTSDSVAQRSSSRRDR